MYLRKKNNFSLFCSWSGVLHQKKHVGVPTLPVPGKMTLGKASSTRARHGDQIISLLITLGKASTQQQVKGIRFNISERKVIVHTTKPCAIT